MSRLLMVLLMLGLAGTALASITGDTLEGGKSPGKPYINPNPPIRISGDNCMDPFILPPLPCTVTGSTAGYTNDYDAVCPYGSTAPDVVYKYIPTSSASIYIDLCCSKYDTKVYVYDNGCGALIACNDDYWTDAPCGLYTSFIGPLPIQTGHIYYIVIDGYGGQSGEYTMHVSTSLDPPVCPLGACCNIVTGACSLTTQAACGPPDQYQWHESITSCSPNPCAPLGCCCTGEEVSMMTTQAECTGWWAGPGVDCDPWPCPGSCCQPCGVCTVTTMAECEAPNIWHFTNMSCTPNPCSYCPGDIVANGDFTEGLVYGSMPSPGAVTDWSKLTGTPQVMPDSCSTAGSIWMWGNQLVGESIMQHLDPPGIVAGKTYRVTWCHKFAQMSPERPPYVRFRLCAFVGLPSVYPPTALPPSYDLIGITPDVVSTDWACYTFPVWTAPRSASWITINPENEYALNDGSKVSSGRIDNICITEAEPGCCCTEPGVSMLTTAAQCAALGGWFAGEGVDCDPNPCPGACCTVGGPAFHWACAMKPQIACASARGIWHGSETCTPDPCNLVAYQIEYHAFGSNAHFQLNYPYPTPPHIVAVAAGFEHSLAIRDDLTLAAWGWNDHGQCNVPSPNGGFVAAEAGSYHSLGLKSDGTIVAWGRNDSGQCNVPSPNSGFVEMAAGAAHSLGLKYDGTIVAWGYNVHGECNVPSPNTGFVAVAAGAYCSLGLKSDGTIVAWGLNDYGQCDVPSPNSGFAAIAGGGYNSLGLKSDGTIVAWGRNDSGQCDVPSPNADFVAIDAGHEHALGLKSDGTIVAWGSNVEGQCNLPTPNDSYVEIAAGGHHNLALRMSSASGVDDPVPNGASAAYRLRILAVRPNPIGASAEIFLEARQSGPVSMTVHDVGGREVATAGLGSLGPGQHRVRWEARDAAGHRLTAGVYFLRLQDAAGGQSGQRVLVIR